MDDTSACAITGLKMNICTNGKRSPVPTGKNRKAGILPEVIIIIIIIMILMMTINMMLMVW